MSNSNQAPAFFAVIPATVLDDDSLSDAAKILYARVASLAQRDGYCWSSNDYLANLSHSSERTISRLLAQLVKSGHISIETVPARTVGGKERRIYIGQRFSRSGNAGVDKNGGGGQKCPDPSGQKCPDPINNVRINKDDNTPLPPRDCSARISEYAGGDRELKCAIEELVANRAEALGPKKAVKTLRTLNGILRDLDRYSNGSRAQKLRMLENAVKNNWLTVYPLKSDEIPTPQRKSTRIREEAGVRYV